MSCALCPGQGSDVALAGQDSTRDALVLRHPARGQFPATARSPARECPVPAARRLVAVLCLSQDRGPAPSRPGVVLVQHQNPAATCPFMQVPQGLPSPPSPLGGSRILVLQAQAHWDEPGAQPIAGALLLAAFKAAGRGDTAPPLKSTVPAGRRRPPGVQRTHRVGRQWPPSVGVQPQKEAGQREVKELGEA